MFQIYGRFQMGLIEERVTLSLFYSYAFSSEGRGGNWNTQYILRYQKKVGRGAVSSYDFNITSMDVEGVRELYKVIANFDIEYFAKNILTEKMVGRVIEFKELIDMENSPFPKSMKEFGVNFYFNWWDNSH